MENEESDEYQNAMQRTEDDEEYFNSTSSITESSSAAKLTTSHQQSDTTTTQQAYNHFKCSFKNCKSDYFDDECTECKERGNEINFYCLTHSDHSYHSASRKQ